MTTRFNIKSQSKFGVPPLPTGYDGQPTNLSIPSVGLEDVDRGLFKFFDSELRLQTSFERDTVKKVPIVFAAGEKWAIFKKGKALRDKNGVLILPIITIVRTSVTQDLNDDISGRGINQQSGEIVIRRHLSVYDSNYQSLINRLLLPNQANLAMSDGSTLDHPVTSRDIGDLATDGTVLDGGLLLGDVRNNINEFIVLPTPQFFTATYEVTIWTQYIQQMNQILECLISSFLPQGQAWRINTDKGYWFIASVDGNSFTAQNNFEEMSSEERIIKYQFSIKIPAYCFAASLPGVPIPVRKYVSAPSIEFNVVSCEDAGENFVDDPFLGADDPTLPTELQSHRRDGRATGTTHLYPDTTERALSTDPALRQRDASKWRRIRAVDQRGQEIVKYVRIKNVNKHTGETVFASLTELGGLTIVAVEN